VTNHCDRCSCSTEGWEDDLCLSCRVSVGVADEAELTDPEYDGWPSPAAARSSETVAVLRWPDGSTV